MNTRTKLCLCVASAIALFGCPKDDPKPSDKPVAASAAPPPSALATPSASASAGAPKGTAKAQGARAYKGAYTSKPADLTLSKDVKWKGDDVGQDGVGEGTLELSIDADGVLRGTGQGALGDVVLLGSSHETVTSGWALRKTPSDQGFSGSFYATDEGGALKGVLRVSRGNAGALREATFTLTQAK